MRLIGRILDLLYPPRCVFCHGLMESSENLICPECARELPYTQGMASEQSFPYIQKCVSPLYYEGLVRESLLRYKFGGTTGYASIYAEIIAKSIDESHISCDIITWSPLSRRRFRKRGYDQAKLIAEHIAQIKDLPCEKFLSKTVHTKAQSSLKDAAARRVNVSGVYKASMPEAIAGKDILIIDDIVTTGSTLSECAAELKRAGARRVYAATVARKRE